MDEKYTKFTDGKGNLLAAWVRKDDIILAANTGDPHVAYIHLRDGTKMEVYKSEYDEFDATNSVADQIFSLIDERDDDKYSYICFHGHHIRQP